MSTISSKVIWLTGASSGIGEALAYELSHKNVKLILSARRKEELERVKGNCNPAAQPNIRILPLDLSETSVLSLTTQVAIQLFGHVDVLINNGGISQRSLAKETTLDVDRRIMEVDYFGTVALTKNLLPHFLQRKQGHYVTVSSVTGHVGTPYRSGYSAAKHALHGFFDSLRAELWSESKSIYVTMICPGWVKTNVSMNALIGDGTKLNQMDSLTDEGLDASVVARKIISAIEGHKNEVYIGGLKEVSAVYLSRYMPGILAKNYSQSESKIMQEWYEYLLVIIVGFGAAFLNTVGGGGSLFSVPILTFLGLPITTANATSRVALLFQNLFAVGGFKSKGIELPWPYSLYLGIASLGGGLIGSLVASRVPDEIFTKIFVGVMVLAVILIIYDPFKSKGQEKLDAKSQIIGSFCFFFIGIYGGFVQAGIGFLVIAVLSLVNNLSLVKSNFVKVFAAIVYTGVSVIVFAWQGKIDWTTGLVLAIGHSLGGWYASRWSVSAGEVWIKRVMIISIIGMAIKLWFF